MEVTEIILAEVLWICQLSSHSREITKDFEGVLGRNLFQFPQRTYCNVQYVLKKCLSPSSSLLKTLISSLGQIFYNFFPEDLSGVLKACLLPSSSLLKTLISSFERIFYNLSEDLSGSPQSMSLTVLVLAEDPEGVLGTNLIQPLRKTYRVSSKHVSYRPRPCWRLWK